MKEKRAAVEEWLLLQRAKEEVEHLAQEKERMTLYIEKEKATVQQKISSLHEILENGNCKLPSEKSMQKLYLRDALLQYLMLSQMAVRPVSIVCRSTPQRQLVA